MAENVDATATHMDLADWLDDLTVRFLLNLPHAELSSMPRLCFQAEEAQWYYEDFIRPMNPKLPSLNLKQFCLTLFKHCPLFNTFSEAQHVAAYEEFLAYKVRVPVRGAILLDEDMERIVLVRGWKKGSSWSFPRGKINKDEKDIDCAIREVWEETGFDIRAAGLETSNEKNGHVKAIDMVMKEQHLKMFVFRGVPLDTHFEPKTRKEISDIQWYYIRDLPGNRKQKATQRQSQAAKYYMVAPFIGHLKKWIQHQHSDSSASIPAFGTSSIQTLPQFDNAASLEEPERTTAITPSDELKRLLSIGVNSSIFPHQPQQQQHIPVAQPSLSQHATHTNILLDMLKGSQHAPASSRSQSAAWPLQELRPSTSTEQSQQLPRTHSMSTVPSEHQHNVSTFQNPGQDHQFRRESWQHAHQLPRGHQLPSVTAAPILNAADFSSRTVMPSMTNHLSQANGTASGTYLNLHKQSLLQNLMSPEARPRPIVANLQQRAATVVTNSGPEIPDASQLPAPQLNAHAKKLLDAFGGPSQKPHVLSPPSAPRQIRTDSQHQSALLKLLGQTTSQINAAETVPKAVHQESAMASPVVEGSHAVTQAAAPKKAERRPTLNEITRTLQPGFQTTPTAVPKTVVPTPTAPSLLLKTANGTSLPDMSIRDVSSQSFPAVKTEDRPKSQGQFFDPKSTKSAALAGSKPTDRTISHNTSPHSKRPSSRSKQTSKGIQGEAGTTNGAASAPQYSILQRPGSSMGTGSPASPNIISLLSRKGSPSAFQPQVLRRPGSDSVTPTPAHEKETTADATPIASNSDTKSQLLALFGSQPTSKSVEAPKPAHPVQPISPTPVQAPTRSAAHTPVSAIQNPPPAPLLVPERAPSQQLRTSNGSGPTQQQQLLDLFSRRPASVAASPDTPISPFTLGTPIAQRAPPMKQLDVLRPKSTLGTSTSAVGDSAPLKGNVQTSANTTPSASTPTETKGVLLSILNGVWEKEGHRGVKRD